MTDTSSCVLFERKYEENEQLIVGYGDIYFVDARDGI